MNLADTLIRKKVSILVTLAIAVLTVGSSPLAQHSSPVDKAHPKPTTETRQALDRLTQKVSSQLATGPRIPVQRKNYIDDYVFGRMERDKIPHADLCSDTEFLRRVSLDLTGRLPEVEAIRKFIKDNDPQKRDKLIDSL